MHYISIKYYNIEVRCAHKTVLQLSRVPHNSLIADPVHL